MLKTTMSLVDKKTKAITDFNLYHGYLPKYMVKNYCFCIKNNKHYLHSFYSFYFKTVNATLT